jgi:ubiquinone/menaquinone biosynthesis C-methylase UbiE
VRAAAAAPPSAEAGVREVRDFWQARACGEVYAQGDSLRERLDAQARARYALEPYLPGFARFEDGRGRDVLEIGVGMGADHALWARCRPRRLCGIDLTPRAVELTRRRLTDAKLRSSLHQADAERLPFDDESFDLVYSWGVLHHSPDTARCIGEVARVLRPGGVARIMVYHRWSLVGFMLWGRYALLRGQLRRSLDEVYFHHMESPGTKAYSRAQARQLFAAAGFAAVDVRVQLSHGDLLQGRVGARHRGMLLGFAKALWPRPLVRRLAPRLGLYLLIEARK